MLTSFCITVQADSTHRTWSRSCWQRSSRTTTCDYETQQKAASSPGVPASSLARDRSSRFVGSSINTPRNRQDRHTNHFAASLCIYVMLLPLLFSSLLIFSLMCIVTYVSSCFTSGQDLDISIHAEWKERFSFYLVVLTYATLRYSIPIIQ